MNITEISSKACTGCALCSVICPKFAITMVADEEGFLYPKCNDELCINCGICLHKCPSRVELQVENTSEIYEAKAKDRLIRESSTSGGIFSLMAQNILKSQGCVYGAGFENDSYRVVHKRVDDLNGLRALNDSKYVQSNIESVFIPLKKDLEAGKKVLFSGTPCQIHAISEFVKKSTFAENLFLCDIVCHGCPSPEIYEKHLAFLEKKYEMKIKSVKFRDKEYGWSKSCQRILKVVSRKGDVFQDTSYYKLYFSYGVLSRPVCEQCRYCTPNRVSDITLGDFWGNHDLENDELGISLIMVNTDKGKRMMKEIRESMFLSESNINIASKENIHLRLPVVFGSWRNSFWSAYQRLGYEKTLKIFTDQSIVFRLMRKMIVHFWK